MAGSSAGLLTCQMCSDPINTEVDDYIKVVCSNDQCIGGFGHVECCKEYLIGLLYYSNTKGGQKKKGNIQQRPHIEMRTRPCWVDRKTENRCEGKVVDAECVKALAQVMKKEKKVSDLAPAPSAKPKPRKKVAAHPQPQTRGPAHGGVEAVGCKRDIEIKPLAARDNRLGTGSKPASDGQNNNKVKNLTLCRFIQSAVGQCPLHQCPYAHSEEEIAKNEQIAREKAQMAKAVKASKKQSKRARGPIPDDLESLPEGALELANGHRSVSMAGSEWEFSQSKFPASTHFANGAADDKGGWVEVGRRAAPAAPGSDFSAGSHTPSFNLGSLSRSAAPPEPTGPVLSNAATQELIRWKLNACTGRLTNLGMTWAVAEAAAKATGADDNAAGELIFSGTDQAFWGEKQVDISAEVAQALVLTEPPLRASRQQVEAAIVTARGNMAEATEALRQQMSQGNTAPLPAQVDPPPIAFSVAGTSSHHINRPVSPAPSFAGSATPSLRSSAAPTAPSVHDEDAWAPKWDDDEASPQSTPQAAAGLQAAAPQAAAPLSPPPPPPPQDDVPPEFLLPGQQPPPLMPQAQPVPKALVAMDVLSGPNTPALQPPPAAVVAASPPAGNPMNGLANVLGVHSGGSSAGSAASSGGGGALIFAGDFAKRQSALAVTPPASPTPQQLATHMAALDVGPAAKQQQQPPAAALAAFPPAMATGGAAAAEEPEDFDDLLDMLMT